jgi:hypothetical protein
MLIRCVGGRKIGSVIGGNERRKRIERGGREETNLSFADPDLGERSGWGQRDRLKRV